MASEIRVNKIENRSGLGTVTFADTGVDLAGIVTATTFSGSGASLTNLPAGNLTGALPAISGANLTGIAATDNVRTGILDVAGVGTFRNDVNIPDQIIHLGDTNTAIRFPSADTITAETGGSERFRVASDGKSYFVGSTSGGFNATSLPNGNTVNINTKVSNDGVSVIRYSGSYAAYALNIGRSKSDTIGTNSIVSNGDDLGHITWYGADGTDFNQAAAISVQVDGSPSDGTDMPGRFVFKTSADGSGTPAERLRIASNGDLLYASSDRNYAAWYKSPTNSSTSAATSSTEVLTFGTAVIANTDVYDTSNGRYTAPVDGLYHIRFNGLIDNNAGDGGKDVKMYKNGSFYGSQIAYQTISSKNSGDYNQMSGTGIMYMSTGDYAQIYASAGMHVSNETNWMVYLIRGTI